MNQPIESKLSRTHLRLVWSRSSDQTEPSRPAAPKRDEAFTRCYRSLDRRLRAACQGYVERQDLDDLVQDVWMIAAEHPGKLAQSEGRTLSWLIGVAKRCKHSYDGTLARMVPLDQLLAREAGDDLDGRAVFEDVEELRAARWGDGS